MNLQLPPALHHRRFTLLWAGLLISVAGSQMQLWSLFWHIRTLSNEPIAVSGIGVARFIPVLLFSLLAGWVADRLNRRRIMFLTQSAMTAVAVLLGLLTLSGQITVWHIYALTGLQAVAVAFDLPARQALIPNLIDNKEHLPSAFSMNSIAFNVGSILGPGLSGIVISQMGQPAVYFFNAVSFLAVLLALVWMGPVPQQTISARPGKERLNPADLIEGVRFILSKPIILSSMLLDFWATFFSSANTLLPYFARDVLHVDVVQYGFLSAAQSIGAVLTAGVMAFLSSIRRQGALLLGAVVIFGLATILFGLSTSFTLTLLALILVGAGDAVSTVLRNTLRQLQTPDHIRGRMISVSQIFFSGGPQLGEIEAGLVAQAFGIQAAIISGGLGCILAVGWVGWRWPELARYNGDEPIQAGSPAAS